MLWDIMLLKLDVASDRSLEAPDPGARERGYADFLADLRQADAWLHERG
jgi:hypothetical protein